ncbi:MAG: PTS sugar transporter subunit IIA [Xanthomonadales bacterium]|nr:PTS sugar transporter subunit IIA [Xanthomonadales bacterium]
MAVGILLLTHPGIGTALRAVVQKVLGNPTLPVEVLEVPFDAALDDLSMRARGALARLDGGEGVLILTDLYGASPSNLAARLESTPVTVRRVSGLNLPMLLRVLNYPEQNLDALAQTAVTGARSGVVNGHA